MLQLIAIVIVRKPNGEAVPPPPPTCPSGSSPKLEQKCLVGICKDVWICRPETIQAPAPGGLNLPALPHGIAGVLTAGKACNCGGKASGKCATCLAKAIRESIK